MPKSKIEWTDDSINPVKGVCPVGCDYCYAIALYKRFKWNPEIRFEPKVLEDIAKIKHPSRIFIGSTFELFGSWVKPEWMWAIMKKVKAYPEHIFIFLTKRPWVLPAHNPWPSNAWVGASANNWLQFQQACWGLGDAEAKVRFLSLEPLLENIMAKGVIPAEFDDLNWIIIGAQTGKGAKLPELEWVREIVEAADRAGIPVFLKDNLRPLLREHCTINDTWALNKSDLFSGKLWRQEYPREVSHDLLRMHQGGLQT